MEKIANRYRIVRTLGEGGMGKVFLVADETSGAEVALKVLNAGADSAAALRFKQEFLSMAQIRHPNLIAAHDYGVDPEVGPFFTMEVVPGRSLEEFGVLDPDAVRALLPQLLDSLAAIHGRGLIHGDIKPENLRLTPENRLVVMDLGLVAQAGRSGEAAFGTLEYMAPEVIRKGRVDHRADLYSVGVVLYRLLTGKLPFEATTTTAFVRSALSERPQAPSRLNSDLGTDWDAALMRLLAKEPADRFATCANVAASLGLSIQQATPHLLAPRFVGRHQEMAVLTDRLGNLLSGSGGGHVALVGEPGSGKTRLVDEFRTRVQLSEAMLFSSRCRPGSYPYQPFADLMRQVVPQARALAPTVAERTLPHLVRLLPDLGIQAAPSLDPDQERIRLHAACADLLRAVAQVKGTVFVLEDWDHADAASLDLMRTLLRTAADAPWLWMVSAEEAREFPTAFRYVSLSGLSEDEVAELAGSMLNQNAVPDDLAARLTTMTSGVPALVEEVMNHWVNAGAITYRDGTWHLEGVEAAQDLPSGLLDLMAARAAGLSAEARGAAQVAAAIGLEFGLPVLAEATGQDAEVLFPLLLEMVGRGIVERTDGVSYRFGQPPMRRALYEQLPEAGRPALHSRIARALEKFGTGSLEDVSGIAGHHLEGEDREAAVRWALEAGRQALDLMAVGDAEKLLERGFALAMAEKAPEPLQLAYREQMGHLCRLTARLDAARQHYEAGLELARKLGDKAALAVCTVALARAHQMRGENKEALARLDEAMPACRDAGDAANEARCQMSLSRIAYFEGRSADAIAHAQSALDVAGRAAALPLVANAQNFLGFLLTHVEPRKEVDGLALLEQSVDLAKRLGDRYQMNESTLNLGNVQLTLGDYPGARESFEACLRYCQEMGATAEEIFALVSLSQVLVEMGRSADALSYAESAASLARGQGRKFPLAFALAMEAQARLILGDLVKARTLVDDALRLAREINNRYVELLILGSQAEIQTFLGDWEGAQETIKAARELMAATGNNEPELKLAILNGYLSAMLFGNDLELRESLEIAQRKHSQGLAARAFAYLAQAARREGRLQEAREFAYEAGLLASEVQLVHLSGEMAWLLGDLARQDDRAEAYDYYFTAHESANLLRAPLLRALALHGMSETAEAGNTAVNFWEQAAAELRKLIAPLDTATREMFLRFPERRAIHADRPALSVAETSVNLNHLNRLTRFATALSRQGSTESVLEAALEEILDLAGGDRGFLLLYNGLELQSRVIAARGDEMVDMETFSSSIAKQVLWTGEPVYSVDALADDRFAGAKSVLALDLKTVLCLPLIHGGEVLGVVYVDSQAVGEPLAQADLEVSMALAQQAAAAIAGARRIELAEARSRAFEAVAHLALPAAAGDTADFLRSAVLAAMAIAGSERGFMLGGAELEVLAAFDRDARPIPPEKQVFSKGICHWAFATGEAVSVLDALKDERWQQQKSVVTLELRTVHCVPVPGPASALGVLYVDSQDVSRADPVGLDDVAQVVGAYLARTGAS